MKRLGVITIILLLSGCNLHGEGGRGNQPNINDAGDADVQSSTSNDEPVYGGEFQNINTVAFDSKCNWGVLNGSLRGAFEDLYLSYELVVNDVCLNELSIDNNIEITSKVEFTPPEPVKTYCASGFTLDCIYLELRSITSPDFEVIDIHNPVYIECLRRYLGMYYCFSQLNGERPTCEYFREFPKETITLLEERNESNPYEETTKQLEILYNMPPGLYAIDAYLTVGYILDAKKNEYIYNNNDRDCEGKECYIKLPGEIVFQVLE